MAPHSWYGKNSETVCKITWKNLPAKTKSIKPKSKKKKMCGRNRGLFVLPPLLISRCRLDIERGGRYFIVTRSN